MQLHRGETSLQGWIKHIQTLEGVLTLPYFSPFKIFTTASEQKQTNKQQKKPNTCTMFLLQVCFFPSVTGHRGNCLTQPGIGCLLILTCISVFFLIQPPCIGNLLIQLFLGDFGAPSVRICHQFMQHLENLR